MPSPIYKNGQVQAPRGPVNPYAPPVPGNGAALAALAARSRALQAQYAAPSPFTVDLMTGKKVPVSATKQAKKLAAATAPNWTGRGGGGSPVAPAPVPVAAAPAADLGGMIPGVDPAYNKLFQQILGTALGLYNTPNAAAKDVINPASIMAGLGGQVINPNQVGKDAGLAFDPQIQQLMQNLGVTKNQNVQDIADIGNWFNQAGQTQAKGAADNAATLAAQLSGSSDAAQAFINALGGSANPGSGGIANAADIATAGLRGQGQAQSDFDNNMKSVLGLDRVQSLTNEKNTGNAAIQQILDSIAQTKGQQGAAIASARDNAQGTKFSQLSDLANMRANLVGNQFNEKQGLRQQKLSELGGLTNTVLGTALAPSQIAGADLGNAATAANIQGQVLSNQATSAQLKAFLKQNTGAANNIASAPLNVRNGIVTQYASKGGPFVNAVGDLKMAPPAIKAALRTQLTQTLGISPGKSLETFLNGLVQSIVTPRRVSNYDKAHKTTYYKQGGYGS